MENLSLKINYFKKKLKMTSEQVAQKAGIPVATIERIASGRTQNPNLKTLKALAAVFECSLDDLINLQDTTQPYYFDSTTAEYAQEIRKNEALQTLFKAAITLSSDNLQAVIGLAERLQKIQVM